MKNLISARGSIVKFLENHGLSAKANPNPSVDVEPESISILKVKQSNNQMI
jgi:hypothetical protein